MSNSPAFQYYPADMATDPIVRFWSMEMLGAYHQMIDYLWLSSGEARFDLERDSNGSLRKLFRLRYSRDAIKLWNSIKGKFNENDGVITHKRVTKELQRQAENRLKKQQAAKKRWKKDDACAMQVHNPDEMQMQCPSSSSSSSSSITNSYSLNNHSIHKGENLIAITPTLPQVKDEFFKQGLSNEEAEVFFAHYDKKDWVDGAGQKITKLSSAVSSWRLNMAKHPKAGKNIGLQLLPIVGKTCGKQDCGLPAVYKNISGSYDEFLCAEHMPKKVKEKYGRQ